MFTLTYNQINPEMDILAQKTAMIKVNFKAWGSMQDNKGGKSYQVYSGENTTAVAWGKKKKRIEEYQDTTNELG